MSIDFSLTKEQQELKENARDFAQNFLKPIALAADEEKDPAKGYALSEPAYIEAHKRGFVNGIFPVEYGGEGASTVDFLIAGEEICAVDPGFGAQVLDNGLGLMPMIWYGSDEQIDKFVRPAIADKTGRFVTGYTVSEPPGPNSGTANPDVNLPWPAGVGLKAVRDGDDYIINGVKQWSSAPGWDGKGTTNQLVILRTDPAAGGTTGVSPIVIEGGTPGISYEFVDKIGHRLAPNATITFKDVRVPIANVLAKAAGKGNMVVHRAFGWSGPIAAIASIGIARTAYEAALEWSKTNSAGSGSPIIGFQNVGYILGDCAAKIEMARAFAWRAGYYSDLHGLNGQFAGAMAKIQITEMMLGVVQKCIQVVGVNALKADSPFPRLWREAIVFPVYDGGNMGMQRRRLHGAIASPTFNPRAFMDNEYVEFDSVAATIDTLKG